MITSGYLDVLDQERIDAALERIDLLHDWWIPRGIYCANTGFSPDAENPVDFYTLGPATYIDCMSNTQMYTMMTMQTNPLLKDYFDWLYDTIIYHIYYEIGPCRLNESLAYPGFHIFGCKPGEDPKVATKEYMERPSATIHIDLQHEKHQSVWNQYSEVDLENCLSFTLCLEVPKTGAGLNTWNEESIKCYEVNNDYSKAIKSLEYGAYGTPTVVPYIPGKMFYFIGPLQHQIAPAHNLSLNDRRITLQGHGVKCDGVWEIYF
jgi:hypothetical protein